MGARRIGRICLLDRELSSAGASSCKVSVARVNGSGGKPDLTCWRRVVTAELGRSLLQPLLCHKADECLNRGPEIAALPRQQVEILPEQRDKIEAGRFRGGAGGDAAVGIAGADLDCQIGAGETGRLE